MGDAKGVEAVEKLLGIGVADPKRLPDVSSALACFGVSGESTVHEVLLGKQDGAAVGLPGAGFCESFENILWAGVLDAYLPIFFSSSLRSR